MSELEQNYSKRIYLSIGEVSDLVGVNASVLRHWERFFDCIKPHKNAKGNRQYTPQDVENLKMIYHLTKERGMHISAAAIEMKQPSNTLERKTLVVEKLSEIRLLLESVATELTNIEKGLPPEVVVYKDDTE